MFNVRNILLVGLLLAGAQAQAEVVVNVKGIQGNTAPESLCMLEFSAHNKDAVKRKITITEFAAEDAQGKPLKVVNQGVHLNDIEPSATRKASMPNQVNAACSSVNLKIQRMLCFPLKAKDCQIKWTAEGIAGVQAVDKQR